MACAGVAFGQGGTIGLYSDPAGTSCQAVDDGVGILKAYVIHSGSAGASACSFSAPLPSCMIGAAWGGDERRLPVTLGDSQKGVAVGYGTCREGPVHVLTINVVTSGKTTQCCPFRVLPQPLVESGKIEGVICHRDVVYPTGGVLTINGDAFCACTGNTAPVEPASWGRVKALYR